MRWLFSLLLIGVLGCVSALSAAGKRLLVVVEDVAEKEKYAVFLGDLEGMFLRFCLNWMIGLILVLSEASELSVCYYIPQLGPFRC